MSEKEIDIFPVIIKETETDHDAKIVPNLSITRVALEIFDQMTIPDDFNGTREGLILTLVLVPVKMISVFSTTRLEEMSIAF